MIIEFNINKKYNYNDYFYFNKIPCQIIEDEKGECCNCVFDMYHEEYCSLICYNRSLKVKNLLLNRKIGDEFFCGDVWLKVEQKVLCTDCYFNTDPGCKLGNNHTYCFLPEENKCIIFKDITKEKTLDKEIKSNYKTLEDVLKDAYEQSSGGKGKERHACDNPFEEQVICEVQRLLYEHPFGGGAYQVIKKVIEAGRLFNLKGWESAYNEMLGAIVYASSIAHLIKEKGENKNSKPDETLFPDDLYDLYE